MFVVPFEGELIQSAFIPFCPVDPYKAEQGKMVLEKWALAVLSNNQDLPQMPLKLILDLHILQLKNLKYN